MKIYLGHLIRFGVDLFDNHKEKLTDQHLENKTDADNKDKAEKNKKRTALRNLSSMLPTLSYHCMMGSTTTVSLRLMETTLLIMIQLWSTWPPSIILLRLNVHVLKNT